MRQLILSLPAAFALAATVSSAETPAGFSPDRIRHHIEVLSSSEYEGRGPGTAGEEKTVAYLTGCFQQLGLLPGNPDGTYVQNVPLVGITSKTDAAFSIGGRVIVPAWINDYIASSPRFTPTVEVKDSEMVFAGYGVVAPEYGWDDFKGVDMRGKTLVVLVNDPPVPDPRNPTKLDDSMFKGKAMTYYGRWSYKYEEASAQGAAACLVVHETGPAGYPFAVVAASQGRENFNLGTPTGALGHVPVEGWLTLDGAKALFAAAGYDFAKLKAAAVRRDFRPIPLGARARFTIQNTIRKVASRNVVARLEGSDPARKDEYVIYTAHWDHLGRDLRFKPDPVFHGALDNASGVAALLEIARAYSVLPAGATPRRSILFLAVTAEEKGLLGSRFYAQNPLYSLTKTLADINMDGINVHGLTNDMESVGLGSTTIDDVAAEIARQQGRFMVAEPNPERGTYYRSDHFEFAKVGVPSCMIAGGWHYSGHPDEYGTALIDDFVTNRYHKVTDTIQPDWTLEGSVQDAQTLFEVGRRVADGDRWPEWKPGNEFKARRDAMMAGVRK